MIAFFCLSIFKRLVLVLMRSIVGRSPSVPELVYWRELVRRKLCLFAELANILPEVRTMFLIPPSPHLRRFHVHWWNFLFISATIVNEAIMLIIAHSNVIYPQKIGLLQKEWSKGLMRRLWFYELFVAVLFLRLMSVGELLLGLSWIEKGGPFLNVALFMGPQYPEQNQSMANNDKAFMW